MSQIRGKGIYRFPKVQDFPDADKIFRQKSKTKRGRLGEIAAEETFNDENAGGRYVDAPQTFDGFFYIKDDKFYCDVKTTESEDPNPITGLSDKQRALFEKGYPFVVIVNAVHPSIKTQQAYLLNSAGKDNNVKEPFLKTSDLTAALKFYGDYTALEIMGTTNIPVSETLDLASYEPPLKKPVGRPRRPKAFFSVVKKPVGRPKNVNSIVKRGRKPLYNYEDILIN